MHEYAKMCVAYNIPNTINNTTSNIINKIYTQNMQGFQDTLNKVSYILTINNVQLQTATYVDLNIKTLFMSCQICSH